MFKPYGVSLKITPRIDRNDVIRSLIEVEASSVDTSLNLPGGPALRMRRASTEFNVRSGSTLVIGGFRRASRPGREWFARVAGRACAGALFASRRYQLRETELAIFVTPRIVSAQDPGLAERARRGRDLLDAAFPDPRVWAPRPWPPTLTRRRVGPYRGPGSQWSDAAAVRAPHNQE